MSGFNATFDNLRIQFQILIINPNYTSDLWYFDSTSETKTTTCNLLVNCGKLKFIVRNCVFSKIESEQQVLNKLNTK